MGIIIKRQIDSDLVQWKNSELRRPLLVRGARQVGKTFSIIQFAKTQFENHVVVNFEERPEFAKCFGSFDIKEIIEKISILTKEPITPGKTLLFFDEIQECPEAILSLRYFYENIPALHVIAAGSLVEFVFQSSRFRMPVGRISFLYMGPISFEEFLEAMGHHQLLRYLSNIAVESEIEPVYWTELEKLLRRYLLIGGMPEIVAGYIQDVPIIELTMLQTSILQTYQADFAKYASTAQHKYLKDIFLSAPQMVGKRYKYVQVNPNVQARDLKNALQLLTEAQCINKVVHSSGHCMPLGAQTNEKKFKILFLDAGLMQRSLGMDAEILLNNDLSSYSLGNITEQFVGQEIIASFENYEDRKIYFWARDAKSSQAEIDFLVTLGPKIYPVEVKSGKTGRLKSLRSFLNEHPKSPFGIRFSMQPLSYHDQILSIPLFMISQWKKLVRRIEEKT